MARNARQIKIIELISSTPIDTQEGLVDALKDAGFLATQATVSRDIKDLGLIKKFINGSVRYTFEGPQENTLSVNVSNIYKNAVLSITPANNLIVVKTLIGSAQTVAAGIDRACSGNVLGTIAGDDTVLVITENNNLASEVTDKLKEMLF